jgi:hypothetical protein
VVFAQTAVEPACAAAAAIPVLPQQFTFTQRTLFDLVCAVPDMRDEEDVQHLAFLAGEFGVLRPSPFYFSRHDAQNLPAPCSLVLRHALASLIASGAIRRDAGGLHPCLDRVDRSRHSSALHSGIAWLSSLSSLERRALARTALHLHGNGVNLLSQRAEIPFRRALSGELGAVEGAEAAERRLSAVRRQLSIVR